MIFKGCDETFDDVIRDGKSHILVISLLVLLNVESLVLNKAYEMLVLKMIGNLLKF